MPNSHDVMITIEIYFNDLKEEKQIQILDALGLANASEANWDIDVIPIAVLDFDRQTLDEITKD